MKVGAKKLLSFLIPVMLVMLLAGLVACAPINGGSEQNSALSIVEQETDAVTETSGGVVNTLQQASYAAPANDVLYLANVVIFIYFSGEDMPGITPATIEIFDGENESLYDYYRDLSYGKILISTYAAYQGDAALYAYQSPYPRSSYLDLSSDSVRVQREKELLSGACAGFNSEMDYTGVSVDKDGDGKVDNISFVVSGEPSATWGSLMWPHAWSFSGLYASSSHGVGLNGKTADYYTFNFFDKLTLGLICHEFGHVLGSPDLYHYDNDQDYVQVGYWDLMHLECNIPQYMTTYMRYTYLGARSSALSTLYAQKIGQITTSGTFTLQPVISVGADEGLLAYRIEINEYESIWIEYRQKTATTYESGLPGSGLIVYRINKNAALGNQKGKHRDVNYPDEVYIFRPNYLTSGTTKQKETENVKKAYLSPENAAFNTVGKTSATSTYDQTTIYTTDGKNTGIVINNLSQGAEGMSFEVQLPDDLKSANQVESVEVVDKDKYERTGIKDFNTVIPYGGNMANVIKNYVTVIITYRGGESRIATMDNCEFVFDTGKIGISQQAVVRYTDSYNTNVVGYFNLILRDGAYFATVAKSPYKLAYKLGEELDLSGLELTVTYSSGTGGNIAYIDYPSRFAYTGYDKTTGGNYAVEITYTDELGNSNTVTVYVSVIADVTAIEISTRNSKQLLNFDATAGIEQIKAALPEYIEVLGIRSDGTSFVLSASQYVADFHLGVQPWHSISVKLATDESIESLPYSVAVVDFSLIRSVELYRAPKNLYTYGQSLDLSWGILYIDAGGEGGGGSLTLGLESFYDEFNAQYNCLNAQKQSLKVNIYGTQITVDVRVVPDTAPLVSSKSESVYVDPNNKKFIRADQTISLADFLETLSSTFIIKVYYNGIYINDKAYIGMAVSDKISVHLYNDSGVKVAEYAVGVLGDTNSDGVLDGKDIEALAAAILNGKIKNDNYDVNKDGVYDIVDFVLLVEMCK